MRLKHMLVGAVILALCILGGLWLFLRAEPHRAELDEFQKTCIEGQRKAIAGDTLPLDDETEGRLLHYCDCVATEVGKRLSTQEVAEIGLQQSNPDVAAKLGTIFEMCHASEAAGQTP